MLYYCMECKIEELQTLKILTIAIRHRVTQHKIKHVQNIVNKVVAKTCIKLVLNTVNKELTITYSTKYKILKKLQNKISTTGQV